MDTKEVKAGEKYKLELLCIHNAGNVIMFETPTGDHLPFRESDIECVSPAAPKYDPCRMFKRGDKVRLVQCNGRNPFDSFNGIEYLPDETIYTVDGDEYDNGKVELFEMDSCDIFEIHHSNIELVTPVEELEPYVVRLATPDGVEEWHVEPRNNTLALVAVFGHRHPNAKAAAEAERDRLNAEYRKEQSND